MTDDCLFRDLISDADNLVVDDRAQALSKVQNP